MSDNIPESVDEDIVYTSIVTETEVPLKVPLREDHGDQSQPSQEELLPPDVQPNRKSVTETYLHLHPGKGFDEKSFHSTPGHDSQFVHSPALSSSLASFLSPTAGTHVLSPPISPYQSMTGMSEKDVRLTNVSENADTEMYDPRVPYILGFSNGEQVPERRPCDPQGNLPSWLKGALYRIGPGIFDLEYVSKKKSIRVFSFEHWNDGLTLVNRIEIDGSKNSVYYRSRFICSGLEEIVRDYAKNNKRVRGTNPNAIAHGKQINNDPTVTLVNGNIMPDFPLGRAKGADHLICLTDADILQEIDPITLIPKRIFHYKDVNPNFSGDAAPAVVQRDENHRETIGYTMNPKGTATYNFFSVLDEDQFDPPGHLLASISAKPSFIHSFAITKNYIILPVYPYATGLLGTIRLYWARDYRDALRFDHSTPTFFHVIDREKREEICIYQASSCFALNTVNAFEDTDGSICLDMNVYDDDTIIQCFGLRNLRTLGMPPFPPARIRRYVLRKVPESAAVFKIRKNEFPEALYTLRTDFTVEFPRINPKFHMKHYRFAYGISVHSASRMLENAIWDCIVKADLEGKLKMEWKEDGCFPSEPIMIPEPGSSDEDSGVLLSVVLDSRLGKSFLLVLDAKTMKEMCRTPMPVAVPFGFHGSWTSKVFG